MVGGWVWNGAEGLGGSGALTVCVIVAVDTGSGALQRQRRSVDTQTS